MSESIADRVARGVEFLNSKDAGWYNKISLYFFDLTETRYCILGQLKGDYWEAVIEYFGGDQWAAANRGFTIYPDTLDDSVDMEFGLLEREWVRVIKALCDNGNI